MAENKTFQELMDEKVEEYLNFAKIKNPTAHDVNLIRFGICGGAEIILNKMKSSDEPKKELYRWMTPTYTIEPERKKK